MKTGNGVLKSRYTYYVTGTVTVRQTQKLRFVAEMHCIVSHPVSQWNPVVRSTSRIGRVAMGMGVWKGGNANPLIRQ